MPSQPNRNQYIDQTLQDVAMAYFQSQANFVATRVFPVVTVGKQSAKYYVFDKNDFLRNDMQRRANGGESAGSGFSLSNTNYNADVFALHADVTNQDRANWTLTQMSIEDAKTQYLTQQALQQLERQWVTDVFATSKWGTDSSPGTKWTNQTTGDPIGDCRTGVKTVLKNTGFKPNVAVFGYDAWEEFITHADVIARVSGGSNSGSPANITETVAAALIGVDEVVVSMAVGATNVEGETAAYDFLASDHVLLIHRPAVPSLVSPSAGYTFVWDGVGDGSSLISIANFAMPQLRADRLEIEMGFDHKITGTDLGYFLHDVVS